MATRQEAVAAGVGLTAIASIVGYGLWSQYKDNQAAAGKLQEQKGKQIQDAAVADYKSKQLAAQGNISASNIEKAKQQELLGKSIQTQAQIDYYRNLANKNEAQITQIAAENGISVSPNQLQSQANSEISKASMFTTLGIGTIILGIVGFFVFGNKNLKILKYRRK